MIILISQGITSYYILDVLLIINKTQAVGQSVKVSGAEVAALKRQIMLRQKSTLEYNMLDLLVPLPDSPTKDQVASARATAQKFVKN